MPRLRPATHRYVNRKDDLPGAAEPGRPAAAAAASRPAPPTSGTMLADEVERFVTVSTCEQLTLAERAFAVVLYIDLVGSIKQAAGMGDRRWRELLELQADW